MDPDDIRELFSAFGAVTVRRMFSGAGVFCDGLMFALITRGVVHLKADAETIPGFEREGCGPFTYATKTGERTLPSYWRMPDRLYDDVDELGVWARAAFAAAERAALTKPPSMRRLPSSRGRSRK